MPKLRNVLSGDDQFNFLITLIGLIMREGEMHIDDVAARMGMTKQAVRKSMSTLVVAGRVDETGFERLPFNFDWDLFEESERLSFLNYDIITDAPRISTRQASAIAAGLSYLRTLPEFAVEEEIDELITLLSSSQPNASPPTIAYEFGTVGADVSVLRKAIMAGTQVTCNYTNQRGESSDRVLEPLRLDPRGSVWYLRAWCPTSKASKSFRLNRMRSVELMADERSAEAIAALASLDDEDRLYVPGEHDTDVIVEVDPEAYELVAEYANVEGSTSSNRGTIRVTIKIGHLPNLGHLISRYGGAARVIEPQVARDIVRNYALASLGESITIEAPKDED